jgi:hypothetical protein
MIGYGLAANNSISLLNNPSDFEKEDAFHSVKVEIDVSGISEWESDDLSDYTVKILNDLNESVCESKILKSKVISCYFPLDDVSVGHNEFYVTLYNPVTGQYHGRLDASFVIDTTNSELLRRVKSSKQIRKSEFKSRITRILICLLLLSSSFGTFFLVTGPNSYKQLPASNIFSSDFGNDESRPPPPSFLISSSQTNPISSHIYTSSPSSLPLNHNQQVNKLGLSLAFGGICAAAATIGVGLKSSIGTHPTPTLSRPIATSTPVGWFRFIPVNNEITENTSILRAVNNIVWISFNKLVSRKND